MARSLLERVFDVKAIRPNICLRASRGGATVLPSDRRLGTVSDITSRQQRILDVIGRTVRERGYPPTVREIGEAVGLTSSSSVHAQLANLERKGLLRKDPTKPRAMTLADEHRAEGVPVPVLGRIAAGEPVLAEEHVEDRILVPAQFVRGQGHFALRVSGESMVGAGILDGDVVVVRSQASASDGDIVAALLPGPAEDEATVKRLGHDGPRVMLIPENPGFEPLELADGRILGKVVAVLRRL
jgi:repressor LexA